LQQPSSSGLDRTLRTGLPYGTLRFQAVFIFEMSGLTNPFSAAHDRLTHHIDIFRSSLLQFAQSVLLLLFKSVFHFSNDTIPLLKKGKLFCFSLRYFEVVLIVSPIPGGIE